MRPLELVALAALCSSSASSGTLDIMLLPHSHQDAGFLVTYSHVRDTLADRCYRTIFECLAADPSKTFNVAEVNFFSHWFDRQNSTVQSQVKEMTVAGQYWFAEGGWVQPDEGCTTVLGRINQATLGQEWLAERLGVFPTTGWHMDPFGNSAVSPKLYEAYGFDSHVVSACRLPRSRMTYMTADVSQWHYHQQLQNVWRGSNGHTVFQHIIENSYGELNDHFDFETGLPADAERADLQVGTAPEPPHQQRTMYEEHVLKRKHQSHRPKKLITSSPPVNDSNIASVSKALVERARTNTQWFQSTNASRPTIMLPWGTDWGFSEDAHIEFDNMDKVMAWINAHSVELNATVRYGTFGQYLDIVHGGGATDAGRAAPSRVTLPVVEGDFFPMDTECCGPIDLPKKVWNCWTGYWSSFPALKWATRKLEHTLRQAEILAAIGTAAGAASLQPAVVDEWEAALGWGRHTAGILQHHDAVTGTGGSACDLEFHTMLKNATQLAEQVIANATADLIGAPTPLRVYSVPAIPPAGKDLTCATHGCTKPAVATCAVSDYVDCAGHGAPALPGGNSAEHCNARGCCWQQSSKHSWCYLPKNESLHTAPQNETLHTDDGTVLRVPLNGQRLPIVAMNSLAWNRSDVVSVRVLSSSPQMRVTSSSGQPVLAQLAPPEPVDASVNKHMAQHEAWAKWAAGGGTAKSNLVLSRLIIRVGLLPLGSTTLFLSGGGGGSADATDDDGLVAISSVQIGDGKAGFQIGNSAWSLRVSPTGLLDTATEVQSTHGTVEERQGGEKKNKTLRLDQDILLYWGNSGYSTIGDGGSESDAYVFAPQGPASSIARHATDDGYWPGGMANKTSLSATAVAIKGPVMEEISACFGITSSGPSIFVDYSHGEFPLGGVWQAVRLFKLPQQQQQPAGVTTLERTIETSYLIGALNNNIDVISRLSTGLDTAGLLHTDEAGWTERAHPLNLDHFSFNSKVGCNYHPTSAWASVQAVAADASVAMLTDRSRAAASLSDGSLEYILHRHATGGNGRGPSDGDPNSARGTVTLVPSASSDGFAVAAADTPRLALMRAHPMAVLYGVAMSMSDESLAESTTTGNWSDFTPLSRSLPDDVHLFSLSRRAFQKLGGHEPDYPAGGRQGTLRLQNLARASSTEVDVGTLFSHNLQLQTDKLEERTLSLARRPDQVKRHSWLGVGMDGNVLTPPSWRGLSSNSSLVSLAPEDIRSFVFPL